MKMTLSEIDEQIREVENRIAVERIALQDAVHTCTESLREAVTSPKTLFTLLGVGFAVGRVVFRPKRVPQAQSSAPVKKAGALGLLTGIAGTALSLAGSRWASVATWAAGKYFSRNNPRPASAPPSPRVRPAVPPVQMTR